LPSELTAGQTDSCYLEAQQQHVAGGAQCLGNSNDHDDDDTDDEAKNAQQQI